MSETSDRLLRGYQAQEKRFLERRFPLRFTTENPILRELYGQAKGPAGIQRPTSRGVASIRKCTRPRCERRRGWCGAAGRGAPIRASGRTPRS